MNTSSKPLNGTGPSFEPVKHARAEADEEAALVAAARAGVGFAFEELVNRSEQKIYRLCFRFTRCREDAEDLVQETFLKAFRHLGEFRMESRFRTWLVRIAVNEGLMKLRKDRSDWSVPVPESVNGEGRWLEREFADAHPDPERLVEQAEMQLVLGRALEALPSNHRVVFLLREVEGRSVQEVAQLLNITLTTAKSRIHRARRRLRKHLTPVFKQREMCQ
jgi:RNA polymerase sigma-70 factor, ECF subfamily